MIPRAFSAGSRRSRPRRSSGPGRPPPSRPTRSSRRARSSRSGASSSACFSLGANGQSMAIELIRCSPAAFSIASQSAEIWRWSKNAFRPRIKRSRSNSAAGLRVEVAREGLPIGADAAITAQHRQFLGDAEARQTGQRDHVTPVIGLGEGGDAAGAADRIDRRVHRAAAPIVLELRFARLHHADQALAAQRVLRHRQIARLEDVERQPPARQQQDAGQREDRQDVGQCAARDRSCRALLPAMPRQTSLRQTSLRRTSARRAAAARSGSADRSAPWPRRI